VGKVNILDKFPSQSAQVCSILLDSKSDRSSSNGHGNDAQASVKEIEMKQHGILSLAVLTAAILMAGAVPASAAVLTSPAGTEYTGEFDMTAESTMNVDYGVGSVTCTSGVLAGKVESNTSTSASGKISSLSFSGCSSTVDVLANGSLSFASGGTVTGNGSQITFSSFGVTCTYGWTGVQVGTLKGGTPATMTVSGTLPFLSGGLLCKKPATWSVAYKVTTPSTLLVD
jgi:hypothetical protein